MRRCDKAMSKEADYLSIVSGRRRGALAMLARAGLGMVEPAYNAVVRTRNTLFDCNIKSSHDLGRTTVSIGNITTGGTGKTPVVQWLANKWREQGGNPAILLRGYRSTNGVSDEAELLKQSGAQVQADPDRIAGAHAVLSRAPATDLFILDDGFQHRRARRDLDVVLIDATNPFGHDHVLPRGLLREPVAGLRRAQAILITRADADTDLNPLKAKIRAYAPAARIFVSRHIFAGLIDANDVPIDLKKTGRCLALAGIGNAAAFFDSLRANGLQIVDTISAGDHHNYTPADLAGLRARRDIDTIITTEKDWVKLKYRPCVENLPIIRAQLLIDFADGNETALFEMVQQLTR